MASEPLLVQRPEEVHQTCFGLKHVSVIINHIDCEAVKVRTKMSEFYIFVWCISSQITGAVGQINENLLNALLCSISERVAAGAKGGACFKGPRLKNKHNQHLSRRLWMLGVFFKAEHHGCLLSNFFPCVCFHAVAWGSGMPMTKSSLIFIFVRFSESRTFLDW